MDAALDAALQGPRGANPLVGAVVVGPDGRHLVAGYHRGAGTAHAEADAIATASSTGVDLRGATRVVYAVDDPHDPAAGGAATLRAAGVSVRSGLAAERAFELNRRWFQSVEAKRPFVTLHIAQTLDSRIAAEDGTSQWISSPESLADNHGIRNLIDAILVGTQTVLVDNPRLTARDANGETTGKQPLRAVMGLRDVPEDAAVRGDDGKILHLPTRDPQEALAMLFAAGTRHVMVEGGSRILSAFLAEGLVDELIVYLAPTLLGSGTPALNGLGIGTLAAAQRWEWDAASGGAVQYLGRDLRLHLLPEAAPRPEVASGTQSTSTQPTTTDSLPVRTGADTAMGGY